MLRTSGQAQALEHSLRKKLSRRAFVRALRVEGGFANSLKAICQGMLNLEDIALSMEVFGSDNARGLLQVLPQLSTIQRCAIIDLKGMNANQPALANTGTRNLRDCVDGCITTHWRSLHIIYHPYKPSSMMTKLPAATVASNLVSSIAQCPTVTTIFLHSAYASRNLGHDGNRQ